MIDDLLNEQANKVQHIPVGKTGLNATTEYLKLREGFFIPSGDENGMNEWLRIEAVTRHLPSGDLVKVTTQSGRTVMASQCKSFLTWNGTKFVSTLGSKVKIGNILPVSKYIPRFSYVNNSGDTLNYDFGYYIGKCVLTGKFQDVPTFAYTAPTDFVQGLIDGYFSGTLTHKSESPPEQYGISFLLSYLGLFGYMENNTMRVQTLDQADYPKGRDVYFDPVVTVEYLPATKGFVYDFTIAKTRNFNLFNGLVVRDTFHMGGASEKIVTTGVPRVEELLSITSFPKTTNCKVYLKEKQKSISAMREIIGSSVVNLDFTKLSLNYKIIMDKKPEKWYESFKLIYGEEFNTTLSCTRTQSCICIKLNMDLLYEYKLSLKTIASTVSNQYSDMTCIFSPDNIGRIDVFVDTINITLPDNRVVFINQDNAKEIYLEEVVRPILYKISLSGIKGVDNVFLNNDMQTFETDGGHFQQILSLDYIDYTRTVSNNLWDIYTFLGIEATRQFLINEFMSIMEGINACHIQILVEKMTFTGTISSVSRYGMRTDDAGPLSKSSFEETCDLLLKAGVYGYEDSTDGVSASIICGKIAKIGTGVCALNINVKALPTPVHDISRRKIKTEEEVKETEAVFDEKVRKRYEVVELGYD